MYTRISIIRVLLNWVCNGIDYSKLGNKSVMYLQILHVNPDLYNSNGESISSFTFEDAMSLVESNETELVSVLA